MQLIYICLIVSVITVITHECDLLFLSPDLDLKTRIFHLWFEPDHHSILSTIVLHLMVNCSNMTVYNTNLVYLYQFHQLSQSDLDKLSTK